MVIHKFVLKGYKPLLHGGITYLDACDLNQLTLITGENGKGKSSVLRELTPYPATRTEYEKNGLKQIEFSHDTATYVLISDFSKTNAHSFIKNDEELNLSGTTEVQESLVDIHLGYSKLIEKLLSGQCRISQMGKPDRKNLFMTTYPSSLLFILEYHKNISSKIRVLQAQLKLLQERKIALSNSIIDRTTLDRYSQYHTALNNANLALDKDIFLLTQSTKTYREQPVVCAYKSPDEFITALNRDIVDVYRQEILCDKSFSVGDTKKLDERIGGLMSECEHLREIILTTTDDAQTLTEEIERLQRHLKSDTDTVLEECTRLLAIEHATIQEYGVVDDTIPVVTPVALETLRMEYDRRFKNSIEYLTSVRIHHWSTQIYNRVSDKLLVWQQQIAEHTRNINLLTDKADKLLYKIGRYTDKSYPDDCNRPCKLRDSVKEIVDSAQFEYTDLNNTRTQLIHKKQKLEMCHERLKMELQHRGAARPIIEYLETFLGKLPWGYFVCSDHTVVSAINTNISRMHNNYLLLISNTTAANTRRACQEKISQLDTKILLLKSEQKPMVALVTAQLLEHEKRLKKLADSIQTKQRILSLSTNELHKTNSLKLVLSRLSEIADAWGVYVRNTALKAGLSFIDTIVTEMNITKSQIGTKLRELEATIYEQNNLIARLQDEIEPNIKLLTDKATKLTIIEQQLSPTKGIPHKYIIRYLNAVFLRANQYIQCVWNYNMALDYFDENDPFDYTFKININDDSGVKDVSICSTGQKAIIDLAITLAICVYRGYAHLFPIKLDEVDAALTPTHRDRLTEFLGELLHQKEITQTFIVNHYIALSSAFCDSGVVALSLDEPLPENLIVKSTQR